jgi:DNA replication protein DnaC
VNDPTGKLASPVASDTSIEAAFASNQAYSSWSKTFTDPRLRAAIVDRLTYNGRIIETGTTRYRIAHARASKITTQ